MSAVKHPRNTGSAFARFMIIPKLPWQSRPVASAVFRKQRWEACFPAIMSQKHNFFKKKLIKVLSSASQKWFFSVIIYVTSFGRKFSFALLPPIPSACSQNSPNYIYYYYRTTYQRSSGKKRWQLSAAALPKIDNSFWFMSLLFLYFRWEVL